MRAAGDAQGKPSSSSGSEFGVGTAGCRGWGAATNDDAVQWHADEVAGGALAGEDEGAAEYRVVGSGRVVLSTGAVADGLGAGGCVPLRWGPHTLDDAVVTLCGRGRREHGGMGVARVGQSGGRGRSKVGQQEGAAQDAGGADQAREGDEGVHDTLAEGVDGARVYVVQYAPLRNLLALMRSRRR